jgi:general secretion pathway protein I
VQNIYFNNPPYPPLKKGGPLPIGTLNLFTSPLIKGGWRGLLKVILLTQNRYSGMNFLHGLKQLKFCLLLSTRDSSQRNGFTFLEVLIALAIVGGLLVTVIYTLNYHLGIVERHEAITIATLLAKEKMADLEKNPIQEKGDFKAPYENYTYETFVKDSQYPGIAEIIVVVNAGKEEIKLNEFIFE